MAAELSLEGFDDLLARVQQLGDQTSKVENKALKSGAQVVQKRASALAPRSRHAKRHMADNIKISGVKTKEGIKYVEVGPTRGDNSEFFYAKFLEFGTSKMAARPFMGPAAEESQGEVIEEMKAQLRAGLGL
ncbi:MAG: HK97-gp10 family putative phage morphogenesis protein [Desulfitobacteriaceae bacterium]